MVVADVTTTPIKENIVIEGGSPMAWPFTCAFWLMAYRVKSGIFSDKVAQNPTIPVSPGIKKCQKSRVEVNFDGCSRIGPSPPLTAVIAQSRRASAATGRKKALNTNSFLMLSTPRYTTYMFSNQNSK